MKTKLLIIGAGFAGFWSALSAYRQMKKIGLAHSLEIVVVNMDKFLTIRPRLYEVSLDDVRIPLAHYFDPLAIQLIIGKVDLIDAENENVVVSTENGIRHIRYDYLIVSSGSFLKGLDIPGMEFTFNVDQYDQARKLERHIAGLAERQFRKNGDRTVVVVGGGFTGLEAVTSIEEKIVQTSKRFPQPALKINVVLIEKSNELAGPYSPEAREYIKQSLLTKGIEMRTGCTVKKIGTDKLVLSSNESIPTATVIWAGGMVASPLTLTLEGKRDALNRLEVDPYLKLPGYDNIILAGDVARAATDDAHSSIMACQFSLYQGKWAGHNAVNDLFGFELKPYVQASYVTCLDLGHDDAILTTGWQRTLQLTGEEAKRLKTTINGTMIYPARDVYQAVEESYPEIPDL